MSDMTAPQHERIPALTLGWRLKMSLAESGLSRDDIAERMDVVPSTISRWMADKGRPPRRPSIVQWAMATGVNAHWLETGEQPTPSAPNDGQTPDREAALAQLAAKKRGRRAGRDATAWYTAA